MVLMDFHPKLQRLYGITGDSRSYTCFFYTMHNIIIKRQVLGRVSQFVMEILHEANISLCGKRKTASGSLQSTTLFTGKRRKSA